MSALDAMDAFATDATHATHAADAADVMRVYTVYSVKILNALSSRYLTSKYQNRDTMKWWNSGIHLTGSLSRRSLAIIHGKTARRKCLNGLKLYQNTIMIYSIL